MEMKGKEAVAHQQKRKVSTLKPLYDRLDDSTKKRYNEQMNIIRADDKYDYQKVNAVKEIAQIKSPLTVPLLIKFLYNKEYFIRMSAAKQLGELGAKDALPYLEKLLKDENKFVQEIAATAIHEINMKARK